MGRVKSKLCGNKKITKKHKLTPKTFIKDVLYKRRMIELPKKRKKMSAHEFEIPNYNEFNKIKNINFNVSQLKQICKHYKQKKTGNKTQLIQLLYNYLYYSNYIIKIQKIFRGHIRRKFNKLKGPAIYTKKCTNESDFYTLDDLQTLSYEQFFSYMDKDGFIYGFDICSLYNMLVNEQCYKNPYNRNNIPNYILVKLKEIVKLGKVLKNSPNINLENNLDYLSQQKLTELRTINIFQKIDEHGHITNAKWYLDLNRIKLKRLLRELLDIWQYRAQITNETKKKIHPEHGNPFFSINVPVLLSKCFEVLQRRLLDIIEIFVISGEDKDGRALGTYYVLGALTIVNSDAATALPWLYESFIPSIN